MPLVSLRRQADYDPAALRVSLETLLAPFGGMAGIVPQGSSVLLKPNLVMGFPPERAVNTHPEVVRAVAGMAREAGAGRIGIGDSPGFGGGRQAAEKAGYGPIIKEFDLEWVEFTPSERDNPDGQYKKLVLAAEPYAFDRVLNLAKLKTHGQMTLTAAAKNLFGCVVGFRKVEWHYRADRDLALFGRILFEIARAVPTHLSIVDGILAMDGLGPTHGKPNPAGFLAAGVDPFAIDAILMSILDKPLTEHPPLAAAVAAGHLDPNAVETVGDTPEACRPASWNWPRLRTLQLHGEWLAERFPRISRWFRRQMTASPLPKTGCVKCGYCASICPAKAIDWERGEIPRIRLDDCIRCYCCHELCPHAAMSLVPGGWLGRLMGIGRG